MKHTAVLLLSALLALPCFADDDTAQTLTSESVATVDESLRNEAHAAIERGLKWLVQHQESDGHWSNPDFPALTALPVWAIVRGGVEYHDALDKAVQYILGCVRSDGLICREPKQGGEGGLCNYNTALCMVALNVVGRPGLVPVVQKAREALAGTQHLGGDIYNGGMGYDAESGRPYADLSNSYMGYEAMRLTQNVEDLRKDGEKHADLDWDAAKQFIQRVQNLPGSNDQPWASDNPEDRGGFVYNPDSSKAGTATNEDGTVRLRSYGSMTYAGLLGFIYAKVDKDDERVKSAFDWAARHWSLDENPGMGEQGLFYFYNVLSKALAAYGQDVFTTGDGDQVNWRAELIKKLVNLQKIDADGTGYWVNEKNRWWEADPVLVTSYSLLALEIALGP